MASPQGLIGDFIQVCERFGVALNHERLFESRLDDQSHENDFQRLLDMQRERCGISHELVAKSAAVVEELTRLGMDEAALSVSRVAVSTHGYLRKWHELWFECKCHLTKAASATRREKTSTTQKVKRRTKPRMPKEKVEAHWQAVMNSGNRDLIHEYLTLAEPKLAEKIGCARNTLRAVEVFQKRGAALREFIRQNG